MCANKATTRLLGEAKAEIIFTLWDPLALYEYECQRVSRSQTKFHPAWVGSHAAYVDCMGNNRTLILDATLEDPEYIDQIPSITPEISLALVLLALQGVIPRWYLTDRFALSGTRTQY